MSAFTADLHGRVGGRRLAGLLLIAAALVLVVAPVPGSGCAPALSALAETPQAVPSDAGRPAESPELVDARAAVAAAQAKVEALDDVDAQVDAKQDAATKASEAADEAESAAREASWSAGTGIGSDASSAQLDVDMAQSSVDSAKRALASAKEMSTSTTPDGYDRSWEEELVSDAERRLTEARADLADKKRALGRATADADAAQSSSRSQQATASTLRETADRLEAVADRARAEAATQRTAREKSMRTANATLSAQESIHDNDVADWISQHLTEVGRVRALNAELADCRAPALRAGVAAAALAVTGLVLLAQGRRLRFPRLPTVPRRRSR